MSLTDETTTRPPGPVTARAGLSGDTECDIGPNIRRVLLVWDAPNLDMGLGSILGRRPTALERPRFDALGRWLLARTAQVAALAQDGPLVQGGTEIAAEPEATVFTNIAPGSADVVRPWVDALRNVGFAVFAKPKVDEDSDVDSDMLEHIAQRYAEGLAALVVASADGQAFRQPLEEIVRSGVPVQVLGFREHASWALASDTLEFVDLEDIAGVFREPLPRIGLDSLPEKGAWLQPFRPLSSLLTSRV
jgi:putative heme uptake system protein